jgi:hypothetical protein
MSDPGKYSGITEAVDSVHSKAMHRLIQDALFEVPPESDIIQWTETLTGFEVGTTVTKEENEHLRAIEKLYSESEPALEEQAVEMDVLSLNEFPPKAVLFMACFRKLQTEYAGKTNLNPHKLRVVIDSKYTVK